MAIVLALGGPAVTQEAERFPAGPPVPTGIVGDARLPGGPATATVLGREDIQALAPLSLDALLREEPGVSLFGEPPGWLADPSTRGLSLRAAGPGGPSRALVLVDGIPINDPFGGSVASARIPPWSVERLEMVHGPWFTVWGTATTGGLVRVVTRSPGTRAAGFQTSYGEHGTRSLALFATDRRGPWGASLEADLLESDRVPDGDAEARHRSVVPRLEYRLGSDVSVALGTWYFTEDRALAAPARTRETEAGGGTAGLRLGSTAAGQWDAALFADLRRSATADGEGRAALAQHIPVDSIGAVLQWTRRFLRESGLPGPHLFTAGLDARWTDGESRESRADSGRGPRSRRAGGRQLQLGIFGQDIDTIYPWLEISMAARAEYWRSEGGFVEVTAADGRQGEAIALREVVNLSTRTAVRFLPFDDLTLRISNANALRPPTLAEQYATARDGDDVTLATPALDPERAVSWELGAEYRGLSRLTLRVTGFWTEVWDAIGEVTLPADRAPDDCLPEGACRQRRNLDEIRVVGGEVEAEYAWSAAWRLRGGYVYQASRVVRASVEPAIEGNDLARVPRHQLLAGVRHRRAGWPTLDARVRYVGARFEDDRNRLELGSAVVVDLSASVAVSRGGEVFIAVENLFDAAVEVDRTADARATSSAPRLVRAGLRVTF